MKTSSLVVCFTAVSQIADALRKAEVAHAEYERSLGHRDDNWAQWYAEFMIGNRPAA